jgi:hypothetical protein
MRPIVILHSVQIDKVEVALLSPTICWYSTQNDMVTMALRTATLLQPCYMTANRAIQLAQ